MFQWDKSITKLDLPVSGVMHLFRSMRDVQMGLPGLRAQEASAYLCQYQGSQGVGTTVVFHLHKSSRLAFYVDEQKVVPAGRADAMLDKALGFVESMGFLMTDLDIQLLNESDREMLWTSLPLQKGVEPLDPAEEQAVAAPVETRPAKPKFTVQMEDTSHYSADSEFLKESEGDGKGFPSFAAAPPLPATAVAAQEPSGSVDDLLAAVEALRARRPGVRSRKKAPEPEELNRRRLALRETIGRILASQ